MIIGIFGGSFDPPHICHILVCQYVLAMEWVDRVLVIPSFNHPFNKHQAPFELRLEMCRLAMASLGERVLISDIEKHREGPSYTIDTIRQLAHVYPSDRFRLIIGSDILDEVDRWKEFDEVKRLAPPIVIPRGELSSASPIFSFSPLSSTQLRNFLDEGLDVSSAIPPSVLHYIKRNRLYQH